MPTINVDAADATELAELLQLLSDWLDADHQRLDRSLHRFIGHNAYGITELRHDLHRFTFLLRGDDDDGQALFNPDQQ